MLLNITTMSVCQTFMGVVLSVYVFADRDQSLLYLIHFLCGQSVDSCYVTLTAQLGIPTFKLHVCHDFEYSPPCACGSVRIVTKHDLVRITHKNYRLLSLLLRGNEISGRETMAGVSLFDIGGEGSLGL